MADLHIPDASRAVLRDHLGVSDYVDVEEGEREWQALAGPVVAVELRRIADGLDSRRWTQADSIHAVVSGLRQRADELDPPQSGGDHR